MLFEPPPKVPDHIPEDLQCEHRAEAREQVRRVRRLRLSRPPRPASGRPPRPGRARRDEATLARAAMTRQQLVRLAAMQEEVAGLAGRRRDRMPSLGPAVVAALVALAGVAQLSVWSTWLAARAGGLFWPALALGGWGVTLVVAAVVGALWAMRRHPPVHRRRRQGLPSHRDPGSGPPPT